MLITTRLSFLQSIQKSAMAGYYFYTTGTVSIEKLPNLIKKLSHKYRVNQTRQQAYRMRNRGEATAKLFCYADDEDGEKAFFVLMFTKGKTPATEQENLKDLRLRKERFEYSDYQLVKKPSETGKQKFTFQLSPEASVYYQERIRQVVRRRNTSEINSLITHLNTMPGFSGIRIQKKKLRSILHGELKRALSPEQRQKIIKMTNFYHRQQKRDTVKRLAVFIKEMKKHQRIILQQLKRYRENRNRRRCNPPVK